MRINDTTVIQFIESTPPTVVIVNELDGSEIILDKDSLALMVLAGKYFAPSM